MKKKIVPKLRQEVKVDIVTSDDIKIYYTGKFQDFTARHIIKMFCSVLHSINFKITLVQYVSPKRWVNIKDQTPFYTV